MATESKFIESIQRYYVDSEKSYRNWGKDAKRPEIYALHCGYHPNGKTIDQYASVKLMTQKIITLAEIKPREKVLDAGCGSGSLLFEAAENNPEAMFFGVNISVNQLETAQKYIQKNEISNVGVSFQDYLATAFPAGLFDKVIYSESATHSQDKDVLFSEARRVLKDGGGLVISDAFLKVNPGADSDGEKLIKVAEEGWVLPPIPTISSLSDSMVKSGFGDVKFKDITQNILPSTRIMAVNAAKRLEENGDQKDQLSKSRLACIAADELMRNGILGYYWITAKAV